MNIILSILSEVFLLFLSFGPLVVYMMNVPRILHYMQLEGYKYSDFMRWLTKNSKLAFKNGVRQLIVNAIFCVFITILNYIVLKDIPATGIESILVVEILALILVFMIPNIVKAIREKKERKSAKKLLVYTGRAKRLMFWNFITVIFLQLIFIEGFATNNILTYYMIRTLFYSVFIFSLPVNMIIANWIGSPTETFIGNMYIFSARRKLRKKDYKNLIRIGITGSYR